MSNNNASVVPFFVDLETTGLSEETDVITEMAWIFRIRDMRFARRYYVKYDGMPTVWSARHTKVLQFENHQRRPLTDALHQFFRDCLWASKDGETVYLVGACPAFDDRFLRKVFREVPYNYHVIDVEVMAMGALGWAAPRSLGELRSALELQGANENPHDALADAEEAELIYNAILARTQTQ